MATNMHPITLESIRDRAYTAMYLTERKYGAGSGPHTLAWKVFCEAGALLRMDCPVRAFVSDEEIRGALDLVERVCRRADKRALSMIATLAERRHFQIAA